MAQNQTETQINYSFVDGSSQVLIDKVKEATLLAPPQHALAACSAIDLAELEHENVILLQKDTGAYSIISAAFSQAGIEPCHYKECSPIYPSYFKLRVRWLLSITRIT